MKEELKKDRNTNNNTQKLRRRIGALNKYSRDVTAKLHQFTTERNNLVRDAVQRMVAASVASVNNGLELVLPSATASTTHVNIIIDEIGYDIRLLRALAAARADLAQCLHVYLFNEANPPKERVRIHFVAAGTGAHFTPREAASPNYPVECLYLTPQKTIFKTLLEEKDKEINFQSETKELYERLHNAAETTPPQPFKSAVESILADLITNPRCAALLVNEAVNTLNSGTASLLNLSNHKSVTEVLTGWVRTTIARFAELNGLRKFVSTWKEIISFALAFVALRFPEMPDCPAIAALLDPDSKALPKLFAILCIDSGLIVDKIYKRKLGDTSRKSKYFPLEKDRLVFDLERGRYECSPAFAAMFKFYFCLASEGQKNWETLESNVADLCVLITKYSLSLKTVNVDIRKHHKNVYRRYFVKKRSRLQKEDPLFQLKKEWLVYPASARVGGSSCEQLKRKMVEYIDTASEDEKKSIIEEYRGKIFGSSSSSSTAANSTVVMISVEKEPFADVIVGGPGRLILLQCKRIDAVDKKISFENEFGKMGALDLQHAKDDETKKAWRKSRKYVDFLKEFCRKNKNDPVEVFAAVILETGSETVLKNRRKVYKKNTKGYKTNFAKLDFFGYSIKRNSAQSTSPLYPLTVGFK